MSCGWSVNLGSTDADNEPSGMTGSAAGGKREAGDAPKDLRSLEGRKRMKLSAHGTQKIHTNVDYRQLNHDGVISPTCMEGEAAKSIENGQGIFAGVSVRFWTTVHMKTLAALIKRSGALIHDFVQVGTDYVVLRFVFV